MDTQTQNQPMDSQVGSQDQNQSQNQSQSQDQSQVGEHAMVSDQTQADNPTTSGPLQNSNSTSPSPTQVQEQAKAAGQSVNPSPKSNPDLAAAKNLKDVNNRISDTPA